MLLYTLITVNDPLMRKDDHSLHLAGLVLVLLTVAIPARAQDGRNFIKVNVPGIFIHNYSLEYERGLKDHLSVGLGIRWMPKSGIPYKSTVENIIDDDHTWQQIHDARISNFAITPEVRYYFGKRPLSGFYLAPFLRYASYHADIPSFTYEFSFTAPDNQVYTQTEHIPISGTVHTGTVGLLVGAQWNLSHRLVLDVWFAGPQYGFSDGSISGSRSLNEQEQQGLKEELDDLDFPIVKTKAYVDENGGRLDISGPWTGLRSGIALAFRF